MPSYRPESVKLGESIRAARYGTGMSQVQVAAILGIKPPAYAEIESGRRAISLFRFIRVCEALKADPVTVEPLLKRNSENSADAY